MVTYFLSNPAGGLWLHILLGVFFNPLTKPDTTPEAPKPVHADPGCLNKKGTQVILLGTGTPVPETGRFGPSTLVSVDGRFYLVDMGPGVVRRTRQALRRYCPRHTVKELRTVFLTHLHSDHTAGYPDVLLTPWVLGRKKHLRVMGPPGTNEMTRHILEAYRMDIQTRTKSGRPVFPSGIRVEAKDIQPGPIYQDDRLKVKAFSVAHGEVPHALGYRFESKDRTIVISGDTAPSDSIVEQCSGCDLLIHEVYSTSGFQTRDENWKTYLKKYHTSTRELARIAERARPKALVLVHQMFLGTSREQILREIRKNYKGQVIFGVDLMIL